MSKIFGKEIKRIKVNDSQGTSKEELESIKEELTTKAIGKSQESEVKEEDIKKLIEEANKTLSEQHDREREELKKLLTESSEKIASLSTEIDKVTSNSKQLESKLEEEKTARNNLEDLFKMTGNKNPLQDKHINFNTQSSIGGEERTPGTVAEFLQIQQALPKVYKYTDKGDSSIACDTTQLDKYVRANRKQFIIDLETFGKQIGFFRGGNKIVTEAPTTRSDVPPSFLDALSTLLRLNNRPGFIFWQFIDTRIQFDKGQGDTIRIPRANYNTAPGFATDRLLSGAGTYVNINASSQNIVANSVAAQILEWGLGLNTTFAPIGIPSFVSAYSILDLMQIMERNLQYDYWTWEDLRIRSLWLPTSRTVWNDRGTVTATASTVGAGDIGTMTYDFLVNLFAYMRGLTIPTFPDGCYGIAMNSNAVAQFKLSLSPQWQAPSEMSLMELTNILNPGVLQEGVKPNGYVGKYANFHIFDSNAFAMGAVGTEGVQNDTLGAGATLTRTSYAFGANTIGRGIGTDFEIRRDTNDDFQRINRFIWRSEEGFVALDVDPTGYSDTSNVPQQLRVLKVNTTDVIL